MVKELFPIPCAVFPFSAGKPVVLSDASNDYMDIQVTYILEGYSYYFNHLTLIDFIRLSFIMYLYPRRMV